MNESARETEARYASVDGLSLYYRDLGPRGSALDPVLCLPGLTRNSRDFEDLAPRIARDRRVLCPDFRGRGLSDPDPDWANYHPGTYALDTIRLLDTLGLQRVAVVGTSLGGLVGMILAATQPGRITKLVLNDIGPEVAPEGLARIRRNVGKLPPVSTWDEALAQARTVNGASLPGLSDEAWHRFVRRLYREDARGVPRLDFDLAISRMVDDTNAVAPDLWPLFQAIATLPMLVIRGALSDLLSPDTLARMHALSPTLVSVEVADRGHTPLLDEPPCLQAIDTFLR